LKFEDDLKITKMFSGEGEEVEILLKVVLNTIILTLKFGLKSGEAFGGRDLITGGLQYLQLDNLVEPL
jgi:hypothetical protein